MIVFGIDRYLDDEDRFELWLINHSWTLYEHLILIAVLGEYLPNYIKGWVDIIEKCTKPLINAQLKNGHIINKTEFIDKWMMDSQMNHDFEDYYVDEFELVLRDVKKKIVIPEIKKPISEFVEPNRKRFEQFYNDFKEAANEGSVEMLDDAIQRFVDTKPIFHED